VGANVSLQASGARPDRAVAPSASSVDATFGPSAGRSGLGAATTHRPGLDPDPACADPDQAATWSRAPSPHPGSGIHRPHACPARQ